MAVFTPRNLTTLYTINNLASDLKKRFAKIQSQVDNSIKSVTVVNNQIQFFTNTAKTGSPVCKIDIPNEFFLDQAQTQFYANFSLYSDKSDSDPGNWVVKAEFSGEGKDTSSYSNALEGKPVMVLAVKGQDATKDESGNAVDNGIDGTATSIKYSFLNMETLVDTYRAVNKDFDNSAETGDPSVTEKGNGSISLVFNGYDVYANVNIKPDEDGVFSNLLKQDETTGALYVEDTRVKDAVEDNLVGFGANGKLVDSGVASADVLVKQDIQDYTEKQISVMLDGGELIDAYDVAGSYNSGDMVYVNNSGTITFYTCNSDSYTATDPFTAADWTAINAWVADQTYNQDDYVVYDGVVYKCVATTTSASTFDAESADWQIIGTDKEFVTAA